MTFYLSLIIAGLYKIHFWDFSATKDTLFWFTGTALVMFVNYNNAYKDHFFRNSVLGSITVAVFIEFLINLYVFNIFVELLLLPILVIITGMIVLAEIKKEPEIELTKKFLQWLLAIIGIAFLLHAIISAIEHFSTFATLRNLRDFILYSLLTVLFLPFIYLLAVYSLYESIFLRVDRAAKSDQEIARFLRRKIFRLCLLNLKTLNDCSKTIIAHLWTLRTKEEAMLLMQKYQANQLSLPE